MQAIDMLKIAVNICELSACITGFIYWHKIKGSHWKCFPFYLGFIVLVELTGKYLNYSHQYELMKNMYNYIGIPVEILFYLYMFYGEFKNSKLVWLPLVSIATYSIVLFIDSKYLNGKKIFYLLSVSYSIGVLLLVLNSLAFLFRLAVSREIIFFKSNLVFWVCVGLLIFYVLSLPFEALYYTLFNEYKQLFNTYAYLFLTFNCFMYISFVIAFIWGKLKLQDS